MVEATILQTKVDEGTFRIDFSLVSHLNFEEIVATAVRGKRPAGRPDQTDNKVSTPTVGKTAAGNGV